ncbi:MAG: AhpC/TSA family protein [Chitinophagaceae bacterium]|nr:AhpC/TSA family protein [Chitinophagaceae bacterium]MCW5928475.1 AhpC/TSA family protein [Chitinophagaceae bacterium]
MNKAFAGLLMLLPLFVMSQEDQPFTISGNVKKVKGGVERVYLYYMNGLNQVTDSTEVVKGKYKFTGETGEPGFFRLQAKQKDSSAGSPSQNTIVTFLEAGKIKINSKDSFSNAAFKGSKEVKVYKEFEHTLQPYGDTMQQFIRDYTQARDSNDISRMRSIEIAAVALERKIKDSVLRPFILGHPQSAVSLFALQQYTGSNPDIDIEKVEPLFLALSPKVQSYPSAVNLKERIDIVGRTAIGRMATDFTQNDTLGNPVSLSSFRGKYLLLDFWASWCQPCRVENPNVVAAYRKYKEKGFDVLGVSLDRNNAKEAWLKAIHDDKLTWTHVSDLNFWNNAAAKLYGIQSIPQNLLISPDGRIIAKNLRGHELHEKLEEIMGN